MLTQQATTLYPKPHPCMQKMPSLSVALFQGHAEAGNLQSNVQKMKKQMAEAKKQSADLIVFPECFTTGDGLAHDCTRDLAEKRDGKTFVELSRFAQETGIAVLYGYPEVTGGGDEGMIFYDSIQFIDKDGNSRANYHKTHLWVDEHKSDGAFKAGEGFSPVFEFCGIKIGLLICFDVEFCEAVRMLALRGAEVILVPAAATIEYDIPFIANSLVASRALENGIHVAYVNHCGGQFSGASSCYGPLGNMLVSAGTEEGLFLAQIDTQVKNSYSYMPLRRPELYKDLVAS